MFHLIKYIYFCTSVDEKLYQMVMATLSSGMK